PAPATAQQPGPDGKFRLTTEKGGQIESVIPVEVVKDPSQIGDNVKRLEMELDPRTGELTPVQPQPAPGATPPATNPPATNPPATNPPATNPPATNPPATPPATPPASTPPANPPPSNPPPANPQ
ncbi:MAG: hypothetical protein J0L61_06565, partial [Planctomycetes bacterium]|nr:hypothetical protein [Planctomycetota bacterium]